MECPLKKFGIQMGRSEARLQTIKAKRVDYGQLIY